MYIQIQKKIKFKNKDFCFMTHERFSDFKLVLIYSFVMVMLPELISCKKT